MKTLLKRYTKRVVVFIFTTISKKVLKKYNPKIIAVTGSVGKTTTKDAIFSAISPFVKARKSEKSFNSEIGIPITILGCDNAWSNPFLWFENLIRSLFLLYFKNNYPEWLVIEVGADRKGDIVNVSKWLRPDVAVITRLPNVPVHIEYFDSLEEIIEEKLSLGMSVKEGGIVVINADDDNLIANKHRFTSKVITYGFKKDAQFQTSNLLYEYSINDGIELPTGIIFDVSDGVSKNTLMISNVLASNLALSFAASLAVSTFLKISFNDACEGLLRFISPNGRMKLIKGIKNTLIIDDSYNSSPVALEEALDTLSKLNCTGRKIVVAGDMLELGIFSQGEHKRIGKIIAKVSHILITVGIRARGFAEGAMDGDMSEKNIFQYENSTSAGKEWQNMLKEGDILLVKGSQGVRMEKFIEEIMADPNNKKELLVRQDDEWQRR